MAGSIEHRVLQSVRPNQPVLSATFPFHTAHTQIQAAHCSPHGRRNELTHRKALLLYRAQIEFPRSLDPTRFEFNLYSVFIVTMYGMAFTALIFRNKRKVEVKRDVPNPVIFSLYTGPTVCMYCGSTLVHSAQPIPPARSDSKEDENRTFGISCRASKRGRLKIKRRQDPDESPGQSYSNAETKK